MNKSRTCLTFVAMLLVLATRLPVQTSSLNSGSNAILKISINAVEHSLDSGKFIVTFTLESTREFSYNYTRDVEGIKPRILASYGKFVDFLGVYDWNKIDLRRTDVYQAQAVTEYDVSSPSPFLFRLLFPLDEYTYHIYIAANGVRDRPIIIGDTSIPYRTIHCNVDEIDASKVPRELRSFVNSENHSGGYSYGPFYDITITMRFDDTYRSTLLAMSVVPLVFMILPLFAVFCALKKFGQRFSSNIRKPWKELLLFYAVFLFSYRTALAPKWLTWTDFVVALGIVVWTGVAVYDLATLKKTSEKEATG